MSLAFLAKKSWHTSNLRNVEKVWIAEQKHAAEEKKLAELKKNIEEERQMQELRKLQAAHGNKSATVERLDWMYQGPMASNPNERSAEEFLLGKEYKPEDAGSDARKLGDSAYGALAMSKPVLPSNDAFSRLNEDPMMLIRSQQKRAQEDILKNPVKMKKIKGQVEKILKDKKEKKKAKKAKKKERKHGKKDKARRSPSASVDSLVSRRSDESLRGSERGERRSRHDKSTSPRRHYRQDARSHHHRSRSPERDERSHRQERPYKATGREHRHKESTRSRSRSPAHRANSERSRDRPSDRHDSRRLPSRSRSRDRFRTDHQRRSSSRDSFGREPASPRHRSRQRERSPDRGRYRNRSRTPERRSRGDNHSKRDDRRRADSGKPKETESRRPRSRSNERHESGSRRDYVVKKPDDGGKYGLIHREGAVEAKDIDMSTLGPNSKFLEKAREKKRQEEDELRQKLSKSTRTTSKMSHEEMVQEAARMAADAKAREEYLMKQATAKREKLDEEEAKLRKDPQFLKQLQDSAYVKGDSSMADRIRRNSHYIQKRAGAGNFLSKD